jgi:tRNA (guanine37-N1)-methyltransferase
MKIVVFSIFPDAINAFADISLLGKAREQGVVELEVVNIRDFASGTHLSVDDTPYGGGAGMVMTPEPIFEAVEKINPPRPLCLLSPGGETFNQTVAHKLADSEGFSLLCGRYEGVDQRVIDHLIDGELSIGDFVLGGGEVAAAVVIEAVTRLFPGVVGNNESLDEESFTSGLLEYPQYTRPPEFREWEVPEVLQSGNHGEIAKWRKAEALKRTQKARPDLIEARGGLTAQEAALLREVDSDDYNS